VPGVERIIEQIAKVDSILIDLYADRNSADTTEPKMLGA